MRRNFKSLSRWLIALTACWGAAAWAQGPPSFAPTVVQYQTYQTQGTAGEVKSSVQFAAPTTAGNTLWVVATLADFAGVHKLTITDTQGNIYTQLDQENDGSPGYQSVAHFYATNIVGDTGTPDIVTMSTGFENYRGLLVVEIAGAGAPPLVGHAANDQNQLGAGTNNVTSTAINVPAAETPALLVALSMNTSGGQSDLGGSGFGAPAPGGNFTQVAQMWNWGINLAAFETVTLPTFTPVDAGPAAPSESFAALYSAPDTDDYVTVAAIFLASAADPRPPSGVPVVSFTATPTVLLPGESTSVSWLASDATGCTASGAWSGSLATSGTVTLTPATSGTYAIVCVNAAGSTTQTAQVAVGSATGPTVVQYTTHQTPGAAGEGNSPVAFQSLTRAGDAIWVAVTVSDYAAAHKIAVSDSQGNVYHLLDQKNDGKPGYQTVAHFYAATIAGDSTTPDVVTVDWPWDSYKGAVIAEIAGSHGAPEAHGADIQDKLAAGLDNVTSGNLVLTPAAAPALLLGLSMNTTGGSSDLGGSGYGAPTPGVGFTQLGTFWSWGGNLATFEVLALGSQSGADAVFNAPDKDSYVTVAAVFK